MVVSEPEVVQLEDGPVTLATLHVLLEHQRTLASAIDGGKAQAAEVGRQAGDKLAAAGRLLLDRRADWQSATADIGRIESASRLSAKLKQEETEIQILADKPHKGLGGLIARVGDSSTKNRLQSTAAVDAELLRANLIQVAQAAPPTTLADAEALRADARALQGQAAQFTQSVEQQAKFMAAREAEIKRRQDAANQLGFDALYTAATLKTHGPIPIDSSLILKRGEQAYMSVAATLARRKARLSFQGGSQGVSFPIGHTGIRYRVGSFRGHPVSQDYLATIDSGTLVLSNQRIAFVGHAKSVAMPLEKILNVEAFTDGLAIFKEGKENADFFLFPTPQQFLMYLNFLLDQRTRP